MNPPRCKHEHEISGAIERWEERYRMVQKDDKELELPGSWKMSALHGILRGEIQKNVEYREKEFRTYEELRSTVMKWAINKKIERERSTRGDPMDTNQAEEHPSGDDWSWWDQEWPSEESEDHRAEDVNSVIDYGNPKGKGKGGKGNQLCYNCGKPGHRAFECLEPKREKGGGKGNWSSSKGKGKGGKETLGQTMSEMWSAIKAMKGKGKGKGSFQGNCER